MMPVIRISDATFKRLQGFAVPLQDSVDDVVKRALDALETLHTGPKPNNRAVGLGAPHDDHHQSTNRAVGLMPKLPQKEFRRPLLDLLAAKDGGAEVRVIREEILPSIKSRLLPGDFATVSTGEPRWWNAICWERNDLVKEGVLRSDSPRGYWELSEHGRKQMGILHTEGQRRR